MSSRPLQTMKFLVDLVDVNNAGVDVASFFGMPTRYRVIRVGVFAASISLTTAAVSLCTASGGGGVKIVNAAALAALTTAAKYLDLPIAATPGTEWNSQAALFLFNDTAQGAAATVSLLLEIQPLAYD